MGRFSKSRGKKKNAEKGAYGKEVANSYVDCLASNEKIPGDF